MRANSERVDHASGRVDFSVADGIRSSRASGPSIFKFHLSPPSRAFEGRCVMAHKNRENQNFQLELRLRLRIAKAKTKTEVLKWLVALLVPILAKVAIHFLRI